MKGFLFLIFLAYGFSNCNQANGQTSTTERPAKFAVHAEIMPPEIKPAKNVTVGNEGVTAFFGESETEITLNYSGSALIEYLDKEPQIYAANVFQLQTGVWIAEIEGGQYVIVYSESGTAQVDLNGEFRVFMP